LARQAEFMRRSEVDGVIHISQAREEIRGSLVHNNSELIIGGGQMIPISSGKRLNGSAREKAREEIRNSLLEKSGVIYGYVPVCNGQTLLKLSEEES